YKTAFGDDTNRSTLGGTAHNISVPIVRFTEFLNDISLLGRGLVVGQAGWEQQLESNKVNYFNSFVQTSRFTTKYPSTIAPSTYVTKLNQFNGDFKAAEMVKAFITASEYRKRFGTP